MMYLFEMAVTRKQQQKRASIDRISFFILYKILTVVNDVWGYSIQAYIDDGAIYIVDTNNINNII